MTPQRAKELLPVITAFAEGKAIEFRHLKNDYPELMKDHTWETVKPDAAAQGVNFSCPDVAFRIKPAPQEFWIVRYTLTPNYAPQTHEFVAYPTEREARAALCRAGFNRDAQLIRVREVADTDLPN